MVLATVSVAGVGWLGCGGSSPSDPEEDLDNITNVDSDVTLNVQVSASATRAKPGEVVDISATVRALRAESVRFSWVNVTGHGELVGQENGAVSGGFKIQWKAPETLEAGSVKVEVIQLVVTAISQVISVTEKGVQTEHDIVTETKTIPITISTAL